MDRDTKTPLCKTVPDAIDISNTLQELIFFFYKKPIRQKVMNMIQRQACRLHKSCAMHNWGTFYVKQENKVSHDKFRQHLQHRLDRWFNHALHQTTLSKKDKLPHPPPRIMFNVCVQYKINRVHFLSFVVEWFRQAPCLISFDSGSNLYREGEEFVLPLVTSTFVTFFKTQNVDMWKHHFGVCPTSFRKQQFGIQFQGHHDVTGSSRADAFCQCWSLFFLSEWIRRTNEKDSNCRHRFIQQWCDLDPCHRSSFLLIHFILPLLANHPSLELNLRKSSPHILPLHQIHDYLYTTLWKKSIKSCHLEKCCF